MSLIPESVHLIPQIDDFAQLECPLKQTLFSKYWRTGFARLKTKVQYGWYARTHECPDGNAYFQYLANNVTPFLPSLYHLGEYDLAINFIGMMNIVRDKVRAKKKVTWIHTDYTNISVNVALELPVWNSFDKIVSISESSAKSFLSVFPSLKSKITVIENILSSAFVRARAEEYAMVSQDMPKHENEICLLSVGRFCKAKNYDNVSAICALLRERLKEYQLDVRWYLIGYGGDEPLIRQKIREAGMEKHVVILGKKENPYPYIKSCDWYVQPSRYEGKSVTVREAQMLCKPVIITNYPTATSQIQHGTDGIIVPQDNEGAAKHMADVICNTPLRQQLTEYLSCHDYGNESEVEKIYGFLK